MLDPNEHFTVTLTRQQLVIVGDGLLALISARGLDVAAAVADVNRAIENQAAAQNAAKQAADKVSAEEAIRSAASKKERAAARKALKTTMKHLLGLSPRAASAEMRKLLEVEK